MSHRLKRRMKVFILHAAHDPGSREEHATLPCFTCLTGGLYGRVAGATLPPVQAWIRQGRRWG